MSGTVTQGWHTDPFGVHEARYFSAAGQPTKLVRDRGLESYDEPPSAPDEVAAAMARMSAMPEPPSGYGSRDPYPYDPGPGPGRGRGPVRPSLARLGVTLVLAAAVAAAFVLILEPRLQAPKKASPLSGLTDVAFVTQAATRTLQQRTADLVVSASASAGGTNSTVQGTGAFDLAGKTGTLNMTMDYNTDKIALQEIILNGYVYLGMTIDGKSLLPAGKAWIAEQAPATQGSGMSLTDSDVTATLASLENQGISVRALGTKVIGGVSCTGYAVTPPGAQATITVWIDPQNLVREISMNATFGLPADGASASAAPTGPANALSMDLTMDFTYSATPLHVTAPPANSTISFDAYLQQLGTNPAVRQLEPSSGTG